jgi:hypothetical protein
MTATPLHDYGKSKHSTDARFRDMRTSALLTELECWCWDLAEFDADLETDPQSWEYPDASRAFINWHIAAITDELRRRERTRKRRGAPPWPKSWPDTRPDAATVKNALPILDYLAGRGIILEQRGHYWVARCPLPGHDDDSPSFTVYEGDRGWYCFGCHRGGDLFSLHMHLIGDDDFARAVRELAIEAGLSPQEGGSRGR